MTIQEDQDDNRASLTRARMNQICQILGVTQIQIKRYLDLGFPAKKERGYWIFNLADCVAWYVDYKQGDTSDGPSHSSIKKQKDLQALKKLELENKRVEEEWVSAEKIDKDFFEIGKAFSDQLFNFPNRLAPLVSVCDNDFECEQIIKEQVEIFQKNIISTLESNDVKQEDSLI